MWARETKTYTVRVRRTVASKTFENLKQQK
jgi:hypothetical protein